MENKQVKRVSVRLTPDQHQKIVNGAESFGSDLTTFIRVAALEKSASETNKQNK